MGALVVDGADAAWSSESHTFRARKDGRNLNLQARETKAKLDRDVTLSFTPAKREEASFATMSHDGAEYLLVRHRPELTAPREPQRRDWVILVETSGDRDPLVARTQVELVRSFLANAGRDDTFVVLAGSTRPIDIAKELIERKADVNAKSSTGMTALMIAAAHNNPPMIGLLIESGADPDAKNNQGQTAADVAGINGNLEAAQAIKVLATAKAAEATPATEPKSTSQ
jgi:hypothetical protein